MPNPKGNPQNLQPIKSNREESLTERINLRITKTMKEELSSKDDPPEFCRRAIEEALDKDKEK
ncbi:hypothetical protein [Nostoc sp.]|uniref:hypothetical protein n=1 Tax=Nostoc sp. TaxID=1180 RepID=UPI00260B1C8E|nr:hypothetical protein [uncultured Nostoc sp.]